MMTTMYDVLPSMGLPSISKSANPTGEIHTQNYAAFHQTLDLRCKDSDDDSDNDESDSDDADEQLVKMPIGSARLPESLSQIQQKDHRRVSSASRRSPHRTPMSTEASVESNEQMKRSERSKRPSPIQFTASSARLLPQIEVEQVYDEDETDSSEETSPVKPQKQTAQTLSRHEARTRMMKTLGGSRLSSLRRSESMDVVTDHQRRPSSPASSKAGSAHTAVFSHTSSPRTPGTAFHHQRSISCPTPTTPQLHSFGDFQVIVTPPTPRPARSPILGVFIRGVHHKQSEAHFCSFDDDPYSPTPSPPCRQCEIEATLKVPEFEMAPGRANSVRAQRQQALAMIALQQQQLMALDWKAKVKQEEQMLGGNECNALQVQINSPLTSASTVSATLPPLLYAQEVRAQHQRHHRRSPSNEDQTGKRSASSWWRDSSIKQDQSSLPSEPRWTGSSASMYSQESESANVTATVSKRSQTSVADSASSWRRSENRARKGGERPEDRFSSSAPPATSPLPCSLRRSTKAYVPPAKRASDVVTVHRLQPRADSTLGSAFSSPSFGYPMSRKEGLSTPRSSAAEIMLARLSVSR